MLNDGSYHLNDEHQDPVDAAHGAEPPRRCAYCGGPAEGNYSIHRDGFCIGPEVPLCDRCGSRQYPTCGEIWNRISTL